jgi:hypothetical protein
MTLIATQEPGRGPEAPSSVEGEVEGDPREAMPELAAMEQSLQQYSDDAKAPNTQLAYAKQWRQFEAWCATKAFSALCQIRCAQGIAGDGASDRQAVLGHVLDVELNTGRREPLVWQLRTHGLTISEIAAPRSR